MVAYLKTFGDYPPKLYRAFRCEQHALDFLEEGVVWLGELRYYREIEDSNRQDKSEGQGELRIVQNGNILNLEGEYVSPVYICCCSYPPNGNETILPTRFGRFIVRINDSRQFGQDLTDTLKTVVECVKVSYTKGQSVPSIPSTEDRLRLYYAQKDTRFRDDYEYRLVLTKGLTLKKPDKFIEVRLNRRLRYADLIKRK